MKQLSSLIIEFQGAKFDGNALETMIKEQWKADGNKVKDLQSIEIYFKPEEAMCYYVANGTAKGSFSVPTI